MPTASTILQGIILPAILVAVAMILAWRPWNRAASHNANWIGGPIVCAAFLRAFWIFKQDHPEYPPGTGDVFFWIFYFAIAIGVLGLIDALLRPPLWLRAILLVLLWQLAARTILSRQIPGSIAPSIAENWIDFSALIVLIWFCALEKLSGQITGWVIPIALAILAFGSAITLFSWHLIASASMAGALGAASLGVMVPAIWNRRISLSRGGVMAVALLLQFLLLHGFFYSADGDSFSTGDYWRAAILLASPLLLFTGDLPGLRKLSPNFRAIIRLAPLLIAISIIAGMEIHHFVQAERESTARQQEEI